MILPPIKQGTQEIGIIMIGGAEIPSEAYSPLALEIQKQSAFTVHTCVASFALNTPEPLEFDSSVNSCIDKLRESGLKNDNIYFTAHSLGGVFLSAWAEKNQEKVKGMILMGSFLERKRFSISDDGNYVLNWKIPTLTIAGEMDGLARIIRMAEAFHKQTSLDSMPVVVLEGVTHMQFASGAPPSNVQKNDLSTDLSEADAHLLIAKTVTSFIKDLIDGEI